MASSKMMNSYKTKAEDVGMSDGFDVEELEVTGQSRRSTIMDKHRPSKIESKLIKGMGLSLAEVMYNKRMFE